MAFTRDIEVRFPDVDYARILYYPRFFDFAHRVFEDFFAAEVGTAYWKLLREGNVGFPTVHAQGDFDSPLRFGDVARVELTCEKASLRSVALRYRFTRVEGRKRSLVLCATLKVVTVPVDLGSLRALPVAPEVRAAFLRHPAE